MTFSLNYTWSKNAIIILLLFEKISYREFFSDNCGTYTEDDLVMKHLQEFRIFTYSIIVLHLLKLKEH